MFNGGRPIGRAVAADCSAGKKTVPFSVDAINDTDYINGIAYGGKVMTTQQGNGFTFVAAKGIAEARGHDAFKNALALGFSQAEANEVGFWMTRKTLRERGF
jgi:hypothetical protein